MPICAVAYRGRHLRFLQPGANNIGNVMGVFTDASPFHSVLLPGGLVFSGVQQLFLLGACAIAVGVYTYSRR